MHTASIQFGSAVRNAVLPKGEQYRILVTILDLRTQKKNHTCFQVVRFMLVMPRILPFGN